MNISKQLSARIAEMIEQYIKNVEAPDQRLLELAKAENALPVFSDLGGVFTVDAQGEIRSFLWDDMLHGQVEYDSRICNIMLFRGGMQYPDLRSLIEKPETANTCPYCNGTGLPPVPPEVGYQGLVCYCGGLGWVP